ncbi:MAG: hypothetical protein LBP83_01655 [Dysgonamonadaceae bacterium]|jgi:REP element-mobilizing transposase RayT|nr:hypothetical protein [Dysgonamonadaceae bacterium]
MSDKKFQNKYRIPSARAQWWDYSNSAAYFVTICTKNQENYFGNVVDGEMQLSEIGQIAQSEWEKTTEMRQDMNLQLGEYVVMPNHFHCIIIIAENQYNDKNTIQSVSPQNKFGPQSKNLASIIRGFKIGVTANARKIHADFEWQSRYHDHIIRNIKEFQRIENYIFNNPANWGADKFYR